MPGYARRVIWTSSIQCFSTSVFLGLPPSRSVLLEETYGEWSKAMPCLGRGILHNSFLAPLLVVVTIAGRRWGSSSQGLIV
jgi:hypothetical protein